MARPPNVRMMPPRKLSVSKCRSSGGALVGGTAVVGACVVLGTGCGVVVLGCGGVVTGSGEVVTECGVVVLGCTEAGVGDEGGDGGGGLGVVGGAAVVGIVEFGDLVVVSLVSSQRATAHSPQSSATATRSFIVCGTLKTGRDDWGVEADVRRDEMHWEGGW